ncbi:MAG: hypothetical protein AAGI45_08355 [Cyanobacteria bacterium P01_H01_bin.26]
MTVLLLSGGLTAFCLACQPQSHNRVPTISISSSVSTIESLRQPEQVERSVPLAGSVTQQIPVLNGWLYQLDDSTGQVWVLTQQAAPAVGSRVSVQGVLRYEAIVIGGIDAGDYYLEEQQRQLQPSAPSTP